MTRNGNIAHHLSEQEVAYCAEAIRDQQPGKIPADLKQHLEQCNQCSAEVAMVADISGFNLQQVQEDTSEEASSENKLPWIVPLLAAAVLLGAVLWIFYPSSDKLNREDNLLTAEQPINDNGLQEEKPVLDSQARGEQTTTVTDTDEQFTPAERNTGTLVDEPEKSGSETEKVPQQALLANFTPDPDMEMLVANYQSAYRGGEIKVKSPSVVLTSEHPELLWENPANKNIYLEITDNKGNEVFAVSTQSSSVAIPQLSPGLYYWKLIEEEDYDLLFAGKIRSEE